MSYIFLLKVNYLEKIKIGINEKKSFIKFVFTHLLRPCTRRVQSAFTRNCDDSGSRNDVI